MQGANAAPSSRHWKVLAPSLAEKLKLGKLVLLGSDGWSVIETVGAIVSTIQV